MIKKSDILKLMEKVKFPLKEANIGGKKISDDEIEEMIEHYYNGNISHFKEWLKKVSKSDILRVAAKVSTDEYHEMFMRWSRMLEN